jgi:hypothetical protein
LSAYKLTLLNRLNLFNRKSKADRDYELLLGVLEASKEQSRAMTQMAQAFSDFIGSFKTDGVPQVYEPADKLAWQEETIAEMESRGLAVGATELDRLRWIAKQVDMAN